MVISWFPYISYIWIKELYYINWMTMIRKSGKQSYATYKTLDSCFKLIRSHQQCIPWSLPLEIEPAATAETLILSHRSTSHKGDAKLTSHGKCATTELDVSWRYISSLQRTRSSPGPRLPKSVLRIHTGLTSWAGNRFYIWI